MKSWGKFWEIPATFKNDPWLRTMTSAPAASQWLGAVTDASNNLFVVGFVAGAGTYSFGSGVSITPTYAGESSMIVKYDRDGNVQWARTVTGGAGNSRFNAVATDSQGNAYAVGFQNGNGSFNYGTGSIIGSAGVNNFAVVKYSTDGATSWAKSSTMSGGTPSTQGAGAAVDETDRLVIGGFQTLAGTVDYGDGITLVSGVGGHNFLVLRYNLTGTTLSVKSTSGATGDHGYQSLAVDGQGGIYACGYHTNAAGALNLQDGVTFATVANTQPVFAKYNTSNIAQWGKTANPSTATSTLCSGLYASNGIYAVGSHLGTGTADYGSGITVTGPNANNAPFIVRYDVNGNPLWARTLTAATGAAEFLAVTRDSAGRIYAGGYQNQNTAFNYGGGITVQSPSALGNNAVMIQYNTAGTPSAAYYATVAPNVSEIRAVTADKVGSVYALVNQTGNGSFTWIGGQSGAAPFAGGFNAVIIKFVP
ncbi:MAG: hypothetical protein KF713_19020 [Turneriella sp.]|nr:hypothetical protein [Turneriella sp.]